MALSRAMKAMTAMKAMKAMKAAKRFAKATKAAADADVDVDEEAQPVKVGKFAMKARKSLATKGNTTAAEQVKASTGKTGTTKVTKSFLKRPAAAAATGEKPLAKGGKQSAQRQKQDEAAAVAERKKELTAMAAADLKDMLKSKNLPTATKGENVEAILALEARERAVIAKQKEERKTAEAEHRASLAAQNAGDLKELCQQKGLKMGGGKEDKVARLFEHDKKAGVIDAALAAKAREARRAELLAMESKSLHELCVSKGVDPLIKEVMVDRILSAGA